MRVPFRIVKLQSDGGLHFVQAVQTLEAARALVAGLAKLWPGEYVIHHEEAGEWVSFTTSDETKKSSVLKAEVIGDRAVLIGERLRVQRDERKLSQGDIEKRTG